jgi:hypothetical protein
MEFGFIINDVMSVLWQLMLTSLGLVSALNTILFSGFISLPIIGTLSVSTILFNPVMFVTIFVFIVRKKLI